MIGLDTNVLLRYFTHDDVAQSGAASRLIDTLNANQPAHVSLVTLAELVWVLRCSYDAERPEIARVTTQLLAEDRFAVQDAAAVWSAVDVYQRENIDFADALIAALDRMKGCSHTVTFDKRATRIPGVILLLNSES